MKTIKLLTLTLVMLVAATTTGQSKESKLARKKAISQLNSDIKELFIDMPFDKIMTNDDESSLSLCFKVSNDGIVEFYHVLGKNTKLVDYAEDIFANNYVTLEKSLFNEEFYWIKVKFKYVDNPNN